MSLNTRHTCMVSPYISPTALWTLEFDLKVSALVNVAEHTSHMYRVSQLWTLECPFRDPASVNVAAHTSHLYGYSQPWTLACVFIFPTSANVAEHTSYLYDFSPLWILECAFSFQAWACVKLSPHNTGVNLFNYDYIGAFVACTHFFKNKDNFIRTTSLEL